MQRMYLLIMTLQLSAVWLGKCHADAAKAIKSPIREGLSSDENVPPFIFQKGRREALRDWRSSKNGLIADKEAANWNEERDVSSHEKVFPDPLNSKDGLIADNEAAIKGKLKRDLSSDENVPPFIFQKGKRESLPGRGSSKDGPLANKEAASWDTKRDMSSDENVPPFIFQKGRREALPWEGA